MAGAFARSLLAFRLDGRPRPFSATFAVTDRCNIRCRYCNWPNLNSRELSLYEIKALFGGLRKMGVRRLGLAGGEPLMRDDIIEIISRARDEDFFISMSTNLLLYQEYRGRLGDVELFFTSLDGPPEKHRANRGGQGHEKVLDAIRDLVGRGKSVIATCVTTGPDYESADFLLDLAERERIAIHFQPECYDAEIVSGSPPAELKQDAGRAFWEYLIERKAKGARISSTMGYLKYISTWGDYAVTSCRDPGAVCAAGRGFIFVDPAGRAYPCPCTKGRVGGVDLLREDWAEKWDRETPCTKCIVGPMLEFNLLFEKPGPSLLSAYRITLRR